MCGLIGIVTANHAGANAVEGLYAQQHRGHEAAGVASADGMGVHLQGGVGMVSDVFSQERNILQELPGTFAIGHVRYSTVSKDERNTQVYQPLRGTYGNEPFCLAHNGNLTNRATIAKRIGRPELESMLDTELLVKLIEHAHTGKFEQDLSEVLRHLEGSFSLLILFKDALYAIRDARGNRPLVIGENGGLLAIASETCAFETLKVRAYEEVQAGTFIRVDANHKRTITRFAPANLRKCAFEPVYFSLFTGETFSIPLVDVHHRIGVALQEECPADVDLVVGVPDGATVMAHGYGSSGKSGIYTPGSLVRHHNAGGRTFILPFQEHREVAVRRKFQFSPSIVDGKRIALIDDSIVRGTTMKFLTQKARDAGAREVHTRVGCPPHRYSCTYGIDTPDRTKLIAANRTIQEVQEYIGADSLGYLSEKTLLRVLGDDPHHWCTACMSGKYWHDTTQH